VAAEEHEPELIVGDDLDEGVEVAELGWFVGHGIGFVDPEGGQVTVGAGRFPA
jgi:hypothetical protein